MQFVGKFTKKELHMVQSKIICHFRYFKKKSNFIANVTGRMLS